MGATLATARDFYSLGYDRSDARRGAALRALENAERLAPDRIDTKVARAYFLFVVAEDLEAAERACSSSRDGIPRAPTSPSDWRRSRARWAGSIAAPDYARRALTLDPFNPYRQYQLCQDYLTSRELVLADADLRWRARTAARRRSHRRAQGDHRQARGELARARELLQALAPEPGDWRTLRVVSRQLLLEREPAEAAAFLERFLAAPEALGSRLGVVRRWLGDAQRQAGDSDAARDTYEKPARSSRRSSRASPGIRCTSGNSRSRGRGSANGSRLKTW